MLPYCSNCQRRIWSGKILTRDRQHKAHAESMVRMQEKFAKKNKTRKTSHVKFLDAMAEALERRRDF